MKSQDVVDALNTLTILCIDGETAFADWTPESLMQHDENVEVYSNCKNVSLSLNGKPFGSKDRNADDSPRTWTVRVGYKL